MGTIWFDDVTLGDRYEGTGRIQGAVTWNNFSDMGVNLYIPVTDMELLNIPEGYNDTFYGNAFGTGTVSVTGPLSDMLIDINARTVKNGDFHIPMSGADIAQSSNLLTFTQPADTVETDPYDAMRSAARDQEDSPLDILCKIRLNVNQNTEAFIELDKASGNVLSSRGSGILDMGYDTRTGLFDINGNYQIASGKYHLNVMSIAKKDFYIQDGSTIKFHGDIMDSEMDIDAMYKLKASLGTLIADSTSTTRRNVECMLKITDKLSAPRVGFSINIPDLDPTTQIRVSDALSSEDKVQKQFLSLLISGSFLPDESSGIVDDTNVLNTTVSEIMSGQLNSIMQRLNLPIDFGLGYQITSSGKNVYDVAVSTQLFNNRVIVNGTIGNRRYETPVSASSEVVGDLDIEIKLDRTGALRLSLFSHSADQYSSYLDNSQRNGVGISYQREFTNFGALLRSIFTSPRKRQENEAIRQQAMSNEERVNVHIERDE